MDILTYCKNESYQLLFEIQEKRKEIDRRRRKVRKCLKQFDENPEKVTAELAMEGTCDFLASIEKFRISIINRYNKLLEKIMLHDLPVEDFPLKDLAHYINPHGG